MAKETDTRSGRAWQDVIGRRSRASFVWAILPPFLAFGQPASAEPAAPQQTHHAGNATCLLTTAA